MRTLSRDKVNIMKDDMKRLLQAANDLKGIKTSAELGRALGESDQTMKNWKDRGVPNAKLLAVSAFIGCDPVWLKTGEGESPSRDFSSNVEEAPSLRKFKDVPVVGAVQGGDNGFFTELDYPTGHGDGRITYPAKEANSYALRVRGDSMRPRIKNGEFIVIEPDHVAQPGDDVVVCFKDGRKMVKELLYTRDDEITLGSINLDHPNITVTMDQVEKIHYVAAIIPRGAFYKP